MPSPRQRSAFSLLELLVAMALIAVLTAVVLPAVAAARTQARQVQCMSNERQLLFGFHSYAQDFGNYLPRVGGNPTSFPTGEVSNGSWSTPTWRQLVVQYVSVVKYTGSYTKGDGKVYACPANPAGNTLPGNHSPSAFNSDVRYSYVVNGRNFLTSSVPGNELAPMNWQNLMLTTQINDPSHLILMSEGGWDVDPSILGNTGQVNRWWFVHLNKTQTYGYADAHVAAKRPTATVSGYNEWSRTGYTVSATWLNCLLTVEGIDYPQN